MLKLRNSDMTVVLFFFVLGGGFRDSLADMAEELCPSSVEAPIPVPFFIRSPNQVFLRLSVRG